MKYFLSTLVVSNVEKVLLINVYNVFQSLWDFFLPALLPFILLVFCGLKSAVACFLYKLKLGRLEGNNLETASNSESVKSWKLTNHSVKQETSFIVNETRPMNTFAQKKAISSKPLNFPTRKPPPIPSTISRIRRKKSAKPTKRRVPIPPQVPLMPSRPAPPPPRDKTGRNRKLSKTVNFSTLKPLLRLSAKNMPKTVPLVPSRPAPPPPRDKTRQNRKISTLKPLLCISVKKLSPLPPPTPSLPPRTSSLQPSCVSDSLQKSALSNLDELLCSLEHYQRDKLA